MRCFCCNKNLSDYESTLRHAEHGDFLDTCVKCLDGLDIPTKGRGDVSNTEPDDWVELESDRDIWDDEE